MTEPTAKPDLKADVGKGPGCLGTTITTFLAGTLIFAIVVLAISLEKIEAWEVGVRFWDVGIPLVVEKGHAGVLNPGYNIIIPFVHHLNKYDASIQRYEMAYSYPGSPVPDGPPIKVRPVDFKEEVDVMVTVLYHIDVNRAGELRKNYSNDADIRSKAIGIMVRQRLQEKLGRMMTAPQFFAMNPKRKKEILEQSAVSPMFMLENYPTADYLLDCNTQARKARAELNIYFYKQGIEIVDILIWDFKFKDDLEASIIGNVIGTAKAEMETSLQQAEQERSTWQKMLAENYAAVDAELARGRAGAMKIDAQAAQYLAQRTGAGDRLVLEAQAEGKGRINQALAGRGGQIYAGLQYAESLKGIEVIVLPSGPDGFNPLDADRAVRGMIPAGQ